MPTGQSTADLLPADTGMGAVTLRVADLDGMTAYYRDAVRLTILAQDPAGAEHPARSILGRRGLPIVILEHAPELAHAGSRDPGLFHTAILFDTEADLAAAVFSVARRYPTSFTGSADHLVSKAFYFDDPEGNGVELYWDRERSTWSWTHGQVEMSTLALDPNTFLHEHASQVALDSVDAAAARVGHVHLSVGDVASAREFYVRRLGFETTAELGDQALFVSAGGYHHHMAMNTWNSRGAGRRRATLGLGLVRIAVPTADALGALGERLDFYRVPTADDGAIMRFADPWDNRVEVSATTA